MDIRLMEEARRQLVEIFTFVSKDSPRNAETLIERIFARAASLDDLPWRGRKVPEYEDDFVREVFEGQYRIIYRANNSTVQVLAIVHRRRILPGELSED